MNRKAAIDAVRYILQGPRAAEAERLEPLSCALKNASPSQAKYQLEASGRREEPSFGMRWRSQTNFLPLVLDVYAQSMKVDNYLASETKETASPWEWWQRNRFDARHTGLIRAALHYGVSYATVLPSLNPVQSTKGAYLRGLSPRQMTCLYGEPVEWVPGETPVDDDWPITALEMKDKAVRLYDEERVHFLGVKQVPQSALGWKDPLFGGVGNFEYIESRAHGVGVCPVVRFRDRWLLDGEEQFGIIEPLLTIQSRIHETVYETLATQYMTAFSQRWVSGWRPQDEKQALTMAAGDVWYFSSKDVKVGQFDAGSLDGLISSKKEAVLDLAAIGQVPAQNLGVESLANISEATLAGLETGKSRKSGEIRTALGESFEQLLRTCAHVVGDTVSAEDFASEVKWSDLTARTWGETVDALGKMKVMLDVPEDLLYEDIPGKTKAWVDRAIKMRQEQQAEMDAGLPQTAQPLVLNGQPRPS